MKNTVTFKGQPVDLIGSIPNKGQEIANFRVKNVSFEDLNIHNVLTANKGLTLLLTVPSLDTPVCNSEVCKVKDLFNENLREFNILCLSKDLPFALKRWQSVNDQSERIMLFSDFPYNEGGKMLGVETSLGLLARAWFVLEGLKFVEIKLISEITMEPDYEEIRNTIFRLTNS